jgi:hypothetical protein
MMKIVQMAKMNIAQNRAEKMATYRQLLELETPTDDQANQLVTIMIELGFDAEKVAADAQALRELRRCEQCEADLDVMDEKREAAIRAVSEFYIDMNAQIRALTVKLNRQHLELVSAQDLLVHQTQEMQRSARKIYELRLANAELLGISGGPNAAA